MIKSNPTLNCACAGNGADCPNGEAYASGCRSSLVSGRSVYTRRVMNLRINQPISEARDALAFVRRATRRAKKLDLFNNIKPLLAIVGIKKYPRFKSYTEYCLASNNDRREQIMTKAGSVNNMAYLMEKRLMDSILTEHALCLKHKETIKAIAQGIRFLIYPSGSALSLSNRFLALDYAARKHTKARAYQTPVWLSVRYGHTGVAAID